MTETKTYPYYKTIPHWFVLRLIVVFPFAVVYFISKFITETLEKFSYTLERILPEAYTEERVEFDKLPKYRQKEIERSVSYHKELKNRLLSQTQRV